MCREHARTFTHAYIYKHTYTRGHSPAAPSSTQAQQPKPSRWDIGNAGDYTSAEKKEGKGEEEQEEEEEDEEKEEEEAEEEEEEEIAGT